AVRQAAMQQAEQMITLDWAQQLMANPQTRLQGYQALATAYPHIDQLFKAQFAQAPQEYRTRLQAEHTVATWSKNKPHFETTIPIADNAPVRLIMGRMAEHDLQQLAAGQPQVFGSVKNGNIDLDHLYKMVTSMPDFPGNKRAKRASSMKGGPPTDYSST